MKKFQAAYVPIGVGTFDMASADAAFADSVQMLQDICKDIAVPEKKLLTIADLQAYLDTVDPDLIILQNLTFANAAYASEVVHCFKDVPLLLWTLREPAIDGTRLRLNSLTGAFSAGNAIRQLTGRPFAYVYGSPNEESVTHTIKAVLAAARIRHDMRSLTIASIGHTPEGFGFGRSLDLDLLETFGVHQTAVEARELMAKAKQYREEDLQEYLQDAGKRTVGLDQLPPKNVMDFVRLYRAYEEYVKVNHIGALASRCWPDFFTAYSTPVCAVLAMLNDLGVAAACEADTYGALSMWVGMQLSHQPVFFGDPVSLNEQENTITFWHCGTAACSLARVDTGAVIGKHCNRHIGPTMEFGTKPSAHATIFRIGRNPDGTFLFLIAKGKALDKPKQFYGTSCVIQTEDHAAKIISQSVKDGWEPHFVVIYDDMADQLEALSDMLQIPVTVY